MKDAKATCSRNVGIDASLTGGVLLPGLCVTAMSTSVSVPEGSVLRAGGQGSLGRGRCVLIA